MYVLDRENLSGVQTGSDTRAVASLPVLNSHPTFGMAAYFSGSIYIAPANSPMLAFPIAGASLAAHLAETGKVIIVEMEERAGYHTTGRSAARYS